jgi:hypothetical protein
MNRRLHVIQLLALPLIVVLAIGSSEPKKATPSPASSTTTTSAESPMPGRKVPLASCYRKGQDLCTEIYEWKLDERAAKSGCGDDQFKLREGCPQAELLGVCITKQSGTSELFEKNFRYKNKFGSTNESERKYCEGEGSRRDPDSTWEPAGASAPLANAAASAKAAKSAPAPAVPKKSTKR